MMRLAARYADTWGADLTPDSADPTPRRPAVAALDARVLGTLAAVEGWTCQRLAGDGRGIDT